MAVTVLCYTVLSVVLLFLPGGNGYPYFYINNGIVLNNTHQSLPQGRAVTLSCQYDRISTPNPTFFEVTPDGPKPIATSRPPDHGQSRLFVSHTVPANQATGQHVYRCTSTNNVFVQVTIIFDGGCPMLPVPAYGTLIFNGSDVHDSQPEYRQNDTVWYQCAHGYTLVGDNGEGVGTSATCQSDGQWSLVNVTCSVHNCGSPPTVENAEPPSGMTIFGSLVTYVCRSGYSPDGTDTAVCTMMGWSNVPKCQADPVLTTMEILIIVATGLGAFLLIFFILMVVLCCKICQLYSRLNAGDLAEDEIAFARSQGAFSLSNPLVEAKDAEDVAGSPLYLTPDELDGFEHKNV